MEYTLKDFVSKLKTSPEYARFLIWETDRKFLFDADTIFETGIISYSESTEDMFGSTISLVVNTDFFRYCTECNLGTEVVLDISVEDYGQLHTFEDFSGNLKIGHQVDTFTKQAKEGTLDTVEIRISDKLAGLDVYSVQSDLITLNMRNSIIYFENFILCTKSYKKLLHWYPENKVCCDVLFIDGISADTYLDFYISYNIKAYYYDCRYRRDLSKRMQENISKYKKDKHFIICAVNQFILSGDYNRKSNVILLSEDEFRKKAGLKYYLFL
jgi:hypothetical protein